MDIQSVIVEGGSKTLNLFLESGLWDEARVFISPKSWDEGILAPQLKANADEVQKIGPDILKIWRMEALHLRMRKMLSISLSLTKAV
uniref:dihydrofolate reductase family protein n=1 Tax=Daejeonella sp. TaxID=2805397 RepID=UPI00404912A7